MDLDTLREKTKAIKKDHFINYTFFSKKLKMNIYSFYNFLNGNKGLSKVRQEELKNIIDKVEQYGI